MNAHEASESVELILQNSKMVYLKTEPEVLDFTSSKPGKVVIYGGIRTVSIDIDPDTVTSVMGFLASTIFDETNITTVLSWNLKSLISYCRFFVKNRLACSTSVIDLQIIENFMDVEEKAPKNLTEAVHRMKRMLEYKNWKPLYSKLHIPLMMRVLPAIETTPLLDEHDKTSKYSFYEIEGEKNGRLRSPNKFSKGYVSHTLSDDQKKHLKPKGYDNYMMTFDIRHCEVSVLQWLSKDEKLKAIIDSRKDLYHEIYRMITGDECNTEGKRDKAKLMFLPVMFGCGSARLGELLNVSQDVGKELISRIHVTFPTVNEWMRSVQDRAENDGVVEDYFGRPRRYPEKYYQARNFVVQGVAATVCLEKLIDIYQALQNTGAQLCFSIHDCYGIVLAKNMIADVYRITKKIIESESKLCPGLFLRAECKIGLRLDAMKVLGTT